MKKICFYLFCIGWLWRNRRWRPTRQKYKALDKDIMEWLKIWD